MDWDWDWMVIIGHRSSKSTFGANNELLWFRNYLTKRTQYTNLNRNSPLNWSIEFSSLVTSCIFSKHLFLQLPPTLQRFVRQVLLLKVFILFIPEIYLIQCTFFFMLYSCIFARIKISFIFRIRIFVHILSLVSVVPHTLVYDQFFSSHFKLAHCSGEGWESGGPAEEKTFKTKN